jgi:hypothetical protein
VNCSPIEPSVGAWTSPGHAQVHHLQHVDAKVAQIVVDRTCELSRALRRAPGSIGPSYGADFGHDHQVLRIGVQRFPYQLVGDMRSVEVARVDVVDPSRDGFAEYRKRGLAVLGRPEDAGTRQLHGAVAHPGHDSAAKPKGA